MVRPPQMKDSSPDQQKPTKTKGSLLLPALESQNHAHLFRACAQMPFIGVPFRL